MEVVFKYHICDVKIVYLWCKNSIFFGVQIAYLWCFRVVCLHDPVVGSFPKLNLVYNGSSMATFV